MASITLRSNDIKTFRNEKKSYGLNLKTIDSDGIVGGYLLNKLPSFDVVTNCYVDIIHDIFEDICHYNMSNAIIYYTGDKIF